MQRDCHDVTDDSPNTIQITEESRVTKKQANLWTFIIRNMDKFSRLISFEFQK